MTLSLSNLFVHYIIKHYLTTDIVTVSNNSGSSSSVNVAIIGGAVGVVMLLLMIIVVLCIVVLCMRRSHRKKGSHVDDNTIKLNTNVTIDHNPSYDVTIDHNPSYDITKANTVDYLYDTINPGGSDVPITTNPSYNVHTTPYSKTSEDEYNYVQPNEFIPDQHPEGTIKMETSPSYGVNTREDRATLFNATSDTEAHQSSHDATTKQYDYAYVHNDHLLHHSKPSNATDDDETETLYI